MHDNIAFPFSEPNARPRWRIAALIAGWFMVLPPIAAVYLALGGCESYCYIWPGIDTVYARDFTHRGFTKVQIGMTRDEVRSLIGRPLSVESYWRSRNHPAYKVRGDEVWSYTRDGGCSWSDWAWLWRAVIFDHGRVVQAVKWTYYD